MYKTKKLLKWIDEKVIKYCKYLEIEKALVAYSVNEFYNIILPYSNNNVLLRAHAYRSSQYFGSSELCPHTIYLNILRINNKTRLLDVIVHELCHLRYSGLEHGKKFDSILAKTIKECK